MTYLWMFELSTSHRDRGARISSEVCSVPWSSPLLVAMMTEYLGTLILVIPNVMGIGVWSPALDSLGNTVRGVQFAKGRAPIYDTWQKPQLLLQ